MEEAPGRGTRGLAPMRYADCAEVLSTDLGSIPDPPGLVRFMAGICERRAPYFDAALGDPDWLTRGVSGEKVPARATHNYWLFGIKPKPL